jgi:hypothetical protein
LLGVERQPAVHRCYRLSTKADIERTGLRIQRDTGKKRR